MARIRRAAVHLIDQPQPTERRQFDPRALRGLGSGPLHGGFALSFRLRLGLFAIQHRAVGLGRVLVERNLGEIGVRAFQLDLQVASRDVQGDLRPMEILVASMIHDVLPLARLARRNRNLALPIGVVDPK